MEKSLKEFLQLQESILDPVLEKMSPELWGKDLKLKKSIRVHIIKKLETWLKNYTNKKPNQVFLLGSMTGLQYSITSDIDINFIIDVNEEILKKMLKELPNGHLLPGTKHQINYYAVRKEPEDWQRAGPIYDILKDKWKKKPNEKPEEVRIIGNYRVVIEMARFFMAGLDAIITEYYADIAAYNSYESYISTIKTEEDKKALNELIKFKLDEIISDIDGARLAAHILHSLRKEAFEKEEYFKISTQIVIKDSANSSINNMIYKFLEHLNYLDKLKEILDKRNDWLEKLNKN